MQRIDIHDRSRLVIVAGVGLVVVISWLGVLDDLARSYVDSATVQSLAAFAVARGGNALISVFQSIQVEPPVVGGFSIQLGEMLDPLNDLVEQYSSIMKLAIASLIGQKLMVEIFSATLFKVLITLTGVAFCFSLFFMKGRYSFLLVRWFAFFAMIRLLLVLVVLMNGIVNQAFVDDYARNEMAVVEDVYDSVSKDIGSLGKSSGIDITEEEKNRLLQEMEGLEERDADLVSLVAEAEDAVTEARLILSRAEQSLSDFEDNLSLLEKVNFFSREDAYKELIAQVSEKEQELELRNDELEAAEKLVEENNKKIASARAALTDDGGSWLSGDSGWLESAKEAADLGGIKEKLEGFVNSMVNLIAIFLIKTLVMPLILLGLFLKVFKYIWGVDPRVLLKTQSSSMVGASEA
ncbi:hypothetical protein [Halomonas ventosae]|uniref:Uncharacterized protein n=1 Tax=Halomonas ventosae TaxID=229007 RepID=A0A2T0VRP1_9GAMM|nr:hypothetical protein [Halomonas ventosae]PRY73212.1 hypothetical protein BCL64_102293 [Halomonas ventosae]